MQLNSLEQPFFSPFPPVRQPERVSHDRRQSFLLFSHAARQLIHDALDREALHKFVQIFLPVVSPDDVRIFDYIGSEMSAGKR